MDISSLTTVPKTADFTPLSEHQSTTPTTFFGARPVLHAHVASCRVQLPRASAVTHPVFSPFVTTDTSVPVNGDSDGSDTVICANVHVFVTSESLLLSVTTSDTSSAPMGVSIPYPAISIHAIQRVYPHASDSAPYTTIPPTPAETHTTTTQTAQQAIYLQLDPAFASRSLANPDGDDAADDVEGTEAVELLIIPPSTTDTNPAAVSDAAAPEGPAQVIFAALSACADLHPDINGDDMDEDGANGLAPSLGLGGFGGGQWITAENAHEFEGEFEDADEAEEGVVGEEGASLGPGAGTRRAREENDGMEDAAAEAEGLRWKGEGDETKWRRTG